MEEATRTGGLQSVNDRASFWKQRQQVKRAVYSMSFHDSFLYEERSRDSSSSNKRRSRFHFVLINALTYDYLPSVFYITLFLWWNWFQLANPNGTLNQDPHDQLDYNLDYLDSDFQGASLESGTDSLTLTANFMNHNTRAGPCNGRNSRCKFADNLGD